MTSDILDQGPHHHLSSPQPSPPPHAENTLKLNNNKGFLDLVLTTTPAPLQQPQPRFPTSYAENTLKLNNDKGFLDQGPHHYPSSFSAFPATTTLPHLP